jgi:hypothetical protein
MMQKVFPKFPTPTTHKRFDLRQQMVQNISAYFIRLHIFYDAPFGTPPI